MINMESVQLAQLLILIYFEKVNASDSALKIVLNGALISTLVNTIF